jgi:uncharacterized protein DUF4365
MATQFPQRPESHQIEDESIAYFERNLPRGWTCDQPQHDYGVDLRIGLADDGCVTGQQMVVQVKASQSAPAGDDVVFTLEVQTLNYLRNMLEVALLVKYIADEREAYWLLLKDFESLPLEGQKAVTVRIPRANRVSNDPWTAIATHVAAVHHRKLNANVR